MIIKAIPEYINGKIPHKHPCERRRSFLQSVMQKVGMEIRKDSELCKLFIAYGNPPIDFVVSRMANMKFLFEYCDFEKVRRKIYGSFKDKEVYVLGGVGGYPRVYPWLSGSLEEILPDIYDSGENVMHG